VDTRIGGGVRVRAHAKINLSLRVLGRREDGYHDLRTVFQALALHDTLVFTPRPGSFVIDCSDARVPTDSGNLVWRAADLLWRRLGRAGAVRDVAVRIEKCIPMKAGLGGGSADAAAALLGLASLWGQQVAAADLEALGRHLGADVPFFFTGGAALGVGRGDDVSPLANLAPLGVLLVFPSFDVSTSDAYRWLDEDRASASPDLRPSAVQQAHGALNPSTGGPSDLRTCRVGDIEIANDFEPVVARRHPQITGIVTDLLRAGATAAAMTGSGSTVFGLFERDDVMAAAARSMNRLGYSLALTRMLAREEYARATAPACL
jgi:4-diphosphocytidyl-2-C-methyl-D-erythritol kinase